LNRNRDGVIVIISANPPHARGHALIPTAIETRMLAGGLYCSCRGRRFLALPRQTVQGGSNDSKVAGSTSV